MLGAEWCADGASVPFLLILHILVNILLCSISLPQDKCAELGSQIPILKNAVDNQVRLHSAPYRVFSVLPEYDAVIKVPE